MYIHKIWSLFVEKIPKICLSFVILQPIARWALESWRTQTIIMGNPYNVDDLKLILVSVFLLSIHEVLTKLSQKINTLPGDESKIIMNRNETDYYEIWQETKKHRRIRIEAIGHSFNTLWFNFLKKFLTDAIQKGSAFDRIEILLISTKANPQSFADIAEFVSKIEEPVQKKIQVTLRSIESNTMFFTGVSVNRDALWLSIREPHSISKVNEHVREWKRESSLSSAKMLAWYGGIIDHLVVVGNPVAIPKAAAKV